MRHKLGPIWPSSPAVSRAPGTNRKEGEHALAHSSRCPRSHRRQDRGDRRRGHLCRRRHQRRRSHRQLLQDTRTASCASSTPRPTAPPQRDLDLVESGRARQVQAGPAGAGGPGGPGGPAHRAGRPTGPTAHRAQLGSRGRPVLLVPGTTYTVEAFQNLFVGQTVTLTAMCNAGDVVIGGYTRAQGVTNLTGDQRFAAIAPIGPAPAAQGGGRPQPARQKRRISSMCSRSA